MAEPIPAATYGVPLGNGSFSAETRRVRMRLLAPPYKQTK